MNKRIVGIDILRNMSMFFVVLLHILGLGGIAFNLKPLTIKYELIWIIEIFVYCAVNCYGLISGYMMYGKKFKYSKIITLWVQVFFYSFIFTLFFQLFIYRNIDAKSLIYSFFPVISNQYWYFTSYFCLYFFIPYLNKLVEVIDEKKSKNLVITIIFLFSVLSISKQDPFKLNQGYSFLWLSILYTLGALIKKYDILNYVSNKFKIRKLILFNGMLFLITFLLKFVYEFCYFKFTNTLMIENKVVVYNSIFILGISILNLMIFYQINIKNFRIIKMINFITPLSFGVYLIHAHPYFCNILNNRFINLINKGTLYLYFNILFIGVVIYFSCIILDYMRYKLFQILKIDKKVENIIIGFVKLLK